MENISKFLKGDKSFFPNIICDIYFLSFDTHEFSLFTGFLNFSKGYMC